MNKDNGLWFTAGIDTQGFQRDAKKMEGVFSDITKQIEKDGLSVDNVFRKMALSATAFFGVQQAQQFAKQIALVRGEFQQLEVAFRVMLGSEKQAVALMNQLVATAAKTPFDLQGVANGAKQLLAFGMESEKINETLVRLGDIAAGLSIPLGDLVYLFGTTMTQGRLYMQDFNQFMGRGIPIADELAKQFGVTKNQVRGLVEEGKIGFPQIEKAINALTSEGGKFSGLMEEQSKTISGQISNIEDAFASMLNAIGKDNEGVINGVLQTTGTLIENYETIGKVVGTLVAVYGTYKAALIVQAGVTKALTVVEQQAAVTKALLGHHANMLTAAQYRQIAVTKLLQAAQASLIATMKGAGAALTNPYVLATAAVVGLGVAIYKNVTAISEQEKATKRLGESTAELNKLYADEKYKVDELFNALKEAKKGTEEHEAAQKNIIDQYGEYLRKLGDEKQALLDVAQAYKTITDELWKASKAKMKAKLWEDEGGLRMEREQEDRAELLAAVQKAYGNAPEQRKQKEFLNIIKRIEEGNDKSNGTWVNELAGIDNNIATLVNRLLKSREQYDENIKLYNSLYGDVEEEQGEITITGKLRNKKYWEDYKKQKEDELAAMTPAAAASKKAAEIRKEIRKADEKLKAYKVTDTAKAEQKVEKLRTEYELESRQALLDLEEETTTKRIEQIHLDYDKTIAEIEKEEKALHDAKVKAGKGTSLTDEEQNYFDNKRFAAEANKTKALEDIRKEELQSMRDYLKEYGTLEQQRLAIAEEYAEKIAKAQTEGEKAALRVQQAQAEKDIQQKAFDKSFDWSAIFQDLQGHTVEYLTNLRDQLQDVLKNGGLDPEQMAIAQEKLRELNDEISRSGGIFDFVGSRQREQNRREQEAKDAKDALTAALGEQGSIETELNLAKLNGAPTNKILALEKQLADAREKTAKATTKAKEAEDSASRNAAQAVADWFADAQEFITEKGIDQIPDLLNSVGLGSLGDKAAQGLSAFNNASGAAADFASGNYIGAALKGINAIKDFGSMLGIGGGADYSSYNNLKEQYTELIEIWDELIDRKLEYLDVSWGKEAIAVEEEALSIIGKEIDAYRELGKERLNAGASAGSHSIGVRSRKNMDSEDWEAVAKALGRSTYDYAGLGGRLTGLFDLTAEQLLKLKEEAPEFWRKLDDDVEDYLNKIIEGEERIEDVQEKVKEKFTGISFDTFHDNFINDLMDMEKSAEDIFDDMAEYYQRAMLSRAVGEKMYKDLEAWYDKYAEAAKSGEGLTSEEIVQLNNEYKALVNEGIKKRDEIAKITGYGDTFKDAESATAKSIQNITSEQANALEGRITAMQIAQEQGNVVRMEINNTLNRITHPIEKISLHSEELRNIALMQVGHLETISRNTHELFAINEKLGRIEKYTQNLE